VFNKHISLEYKFTSPIRQLLSTIEYTYSIGLASISTVIVLVLPWLSLILDRIIVSLRR
jgi:hypothetical protein